MRALVTGGGGFLGRYIVEQLLARGDQVRILARGEYPELAAAGVDCRRGDLRHARDTAAATADIDTVFHVAALAGVWGRRADYFSVNVDGTCSLLAASRQSGVTGFVYTSSPSVVYAMQDICAGDESLPYPGRFYAHYPASKAAAEQLVLAANSDGLATCALRPHLIWGPRDTHIIPMLASRAAAGRLLRVGDGHNQVDVSYVENAARAHLQAADALGHDSPVAGQAYFIGDQQPVVMWQWINELLAALHLPTVERHIGRVTAYGLGAVLETLYTVLPLSGEPRLTRFLAAQFSTSHYFSHAKANRDFGYAPQVDNGEGLRRTVAWWQSQH